MPQTRPNGTVVPINSDEYNLTADLATMADSLNVNAVVADAAAQAALTPFEGMQSFRLDTGEIESYWSGAWRPGTREYAPLSPTSWSVSGTITATPEGIKRRVTVDITVTRTGGAFTVAASSWALIGTVIPAAVQGSSPVKYPVVAVVGGANNITANAALNPSGSLSIRSTGDFNFTTNALFTINAVYYI